MATNVGDLVVRLQGDNRGYVRMMGHSIYLAQKFGQTARSVTRSVANVATKIGKPVAAAAGFSVYQFGKFDQAMTESTSIMGNLSDDTKKQMSDLALSMSKDAIQGPTELARSYFYLASAGLDAAQSMKALPAVTSFATAGAFDMARATDLLTDAQSALGLTVKDPVKNLENMTRVSDVLVKANTLANATVEQFSEALTSKAGAALKVYGKDMEEGVAVLAAYADQGIKASLAGENLNRVMLLLSKSAVNNTSAHKKYGFQVFDANGKMRNMGDIIQNLTDITSGMSDETRAAALAEMGFEARVQGAILPLLKQGEAIKNYEAQLRAAGGTTQEVADKQMKSFANQMKVVWNSIKVAAIQIGEVLAPYVQKAAMWIKNGLENNLSNFIAKLKYFINLVRFVFANWNDIIRYTVNLWITHLVGQFNDAVYFFTTVLPAVIRIMPKVFKEAFTVVVNNAKAFYKALIGAIKGQGFNFAFQGISEAFMEEIKKVPTIGDRELTEFEKQQQQQLRILEDKMGKSWNQIFTPPEEEKPAVVEQAEQVSENVAKEAEVVKKKVNEMNEAFMSSSAAVRANTAELDELLGRVGVSGGEPAGPPRAETWGEFAPLARKQLNTMADKSMPNTMSMLVKGIERLVEIGEEQLENPSVELETMEGAEA